jgi:glycosyltransferase involved in cell wall biosynthesis
VTPTPLTPRAERAAPVRVLVISHGHPDFALGGGELAAHSLYRTLRATAGVDAAWFLARVDRPGGPTGAITLRRPDEYLWDQGLSDWHLLRTAHAPSMDLEFAELLAALAPTVVHVHHYAHIGLEMLRTLRRCLPDARIVLTLHEYMAICRHDGQMVRRGSLQLCRKDTPQDCHRCFPEHAPEDFWLRRRYVRHHFDLVDAFVAPSRFLRQRYVEWGLDPARIAVIENGQPEEAPLPPRAAEPGAPRNRFAFFGQVNPYKGLDRLLEGLVALGAPARASLVVEVNCAHLERQPAALRERIEALAAPLLAEGTLVWRGPYVPEELRSRMAGIDWVLVPSIWWENSPLVIQEAFRFGRPVICSDIGGMAEKVRHDVDGLHVPAGEAAAWGATLARLAGDPATWERLRAGVTPPPDHAACARAHLALFGSIGARPAGTGGTGGVVLPLSSAARIPHGASDGAPRAPLAPSRPPQAVPRSA